MQHENENQTELELKMKMFEMAVANGELDHLYSGPAIFKFKKQLHRLTEAALQEGSEHDTELQMFQSVIGMVNTLVSECRVHELFNILKDNYPEYYLNHSEQILRA